MLLRISITAPSTLLLFSTHDTVLQIVTLSVINPWCNSPLRARVYQLLASYPLAADRDQRSSTWFCYDMWSPRESPSCCWLSRPRLLLQINSYPNSLHCLVGTDPYCGKKSSLTGDRTNVAPCSKSSNHHP